MPRYWPPTSRNSPRTARRTRTAPHRTAPRPASPTTSSPSDAATTPAPFTGPSPMISPTSISPRSHRCGSSTGSRRPDNAQTRSGITAGQKNAVRAAKDYLAYTAFSRQGLIEQLEFENYSTEVATFAVDYVAPEWNMQAAKAAQDYLDYTAFSRQGLIDQLMFEGYTSAQAQYGVDQTGL